MKTLKSFFVVGLLATLSAAASGCTTDLPQAHRGRLFDRTGFWAFYTGGNGLTGRVRDSGTHFTGMYDELRAVSCGQVTKRETLHSLTKDGVQFELDVYTRFSADCSDSGVKTLLRTIQTDENGYINTEQLYSNFVRPAIGEAARETVSPYVANDVNTHRERIVAEIRSRFLQMMNAMRPKVVLIQEVNLSNLDFPEAMDVANTERAVQAVKKDTAIAERERVEAETTTATMRIGLSRQQALQQTAVIDEVGAALRRNPGYLTYQMQQLMPQIYERAGAQGNMVIAAPSPNIMVSPHGTSVAR